MRPSAPDPDEMRAVAFERGFPSTPRAPASCKFGDTHVLCTASLEERVPPLDAQFRQGLGDGRIRHAAALDRRPHAPRGVGRQAGRTHAGNPAPDRPLPARRRRSRGARRDADHRRLRRHPGRRRHPHGLDHRRLDRASRLPAVDGKPPDGQGRAGPARTMSRRSPAAFTRAQPVSTSTMPRIRRPKPTPISS